MSEHKTVRVVVGNTDVSAKLDLSTWGWTDAIRALCEGDLDAKTMEARHARRDSWSPDGSHERYEVFAGWRTPAGHGCGESWSGRNYWADVYYAADEEEASA